MHDGHLALGLHGELDLACTSMLESDGHEDDKTIHDVTVDMADLEFIDTAGVRALIEVKTRHSARGRRVHLVNSARLVRKVVTLYGRSDLLAG
jgi:anti-anti-sigma factor